MEVTTSTAGQSAAVAQYQHTVVVDDASLLRRADDEFKETCFLKGVRLLRTVSDKSLLDKRQLELIEIADRLESVIQELTSLHAPTEDGWKKQSEVHHKWDAQIFYRVDENHRLFLRMDFLIESSLLVPFLSVLNESQLYATWLPKWNYPRVGIRQALKLKEMGRGNQIILVTVDLPYPFLVRECVQHAMAVDEIDQSGSIVIAVKSVPPGYEEVTAEPEPNVVRIDFEATFVIRSCPTDHPLLTKSTKQYPADDQLLLVSIKQFVDSHVDYVPLTLINFFTRIVIKQMLVNLLQVADDVRSGKRPQHQEAIKEQPELYDWVEKRVSYMCSLSSQ